MNFYQKTHFFLVFDIYEFLKFSINRRNFSEREFFLLTLTPIFKVKSLNLQKSVFILYLGNSQDRYNQT